jgi:DNA-directed RNA polymerase specialized sigma24 family protein
MKNSNNLAIEKEGGISQDTLLMEFETIRPKLKSYLFRITAHKEDTEDLLQETYIKVSDNLLTFQKNRP